MIDRIVRVGVRYMRAITPESFVIHAVFHVPLTFVFLRVLWESLSWMTVNDGPIFMYSGMLMDRFHMVPVRDFFTYNMIGTHVMFRWLYRIFGGTILGIRIADAATLAVILALMARMLAPFGRRVAWAGAVLFGSFQYFYLEHCSLEREYLGIVPLLLAALFATAWCPDRPRVRCFMTGLFCGTLITIKPHLAIGALPLYTYLVLDRESDGPYGWREWTARAVRIAFWCGVGGILPVLWMVGYYAYYGILGEFLRTSSVYFPLHADISAENEVFKPGERLPYLFQMFFSWRPWNNSFALAAGTIAGIALFMLTPEIPRRQRRLGYLIMGLQAAYLAYPVFAARFYDYHYYPFWLFCCFWIAFCLRAWPAGAPFRSRAFGFVFAFYVVSSLFYSNYFEIKRTPPELTEPMARTERMSRWLSRRLVPGDTVQPIEWGFCGAIHATMRTGARIPTRILWGEVLFHHVSNPFVVELRKSFVDELAAAKPRFIVRSEMDIDYIEGADCTKSFPALDAFLKRDYFIALRSRDFTIWESNASPTAEEDKALRKSKLEAQ